MSLLSVVESTSHSPCWYTNVQHCNVTGYMCTYERIIISHEDLGTLYNITVYIVRCANCVPDLFNLVCMMSRCNYSRALHLITSYYRVISTIYLKLQDEAAIYLVILMSQ